MRITYELENTTTPITVHHGGPRGSETLSFEIGGNNSSLLLLFTLSNTLITADEKLVAVYGTRLANPGPWGDQKYVTRIYLRCVSPQVICSIIQYCPVVVRSREFLQERANN